MVKCSVVGCDNKTQVKRPGISFHKFPKKNELRLRWLNAINRPEFKPTEESKVCSHHFNVNDINYTLNRQRLKDDACPFLRTPNLPQQARQPLQKLDLNLCPETIIDVSQSRNQDIMLPSTRHSPKARVVTAASVKDVIIFKDKSLGICKTAESEQNMIRKLRKQNLILKKKLKMLNQKTRRQKKKIISLKSLYTDLIKKQMISHDNLNILNECLGPKEFLERQILKHRGESVPKTYGPELRTFALTLNFLSPKAYEYVRSTYNTALPHPRTLCKWYESVDAEPGFSKESLITLKKFTENSSHPIFCSLIIDEMCIRKSLEWDSVKKIYRGRVNTGNNIDSDSLEYATEALVFLVTAINGSWKLPVAYFLIHSLNGVQKANLLKMCLVQLKECNVHIVSLTFDGAASNIGMAVSLGCNFQITNENLVTKFDYEGVSVNVFFDPCHMIKLVRNAFGELRELVNEAGEIIDFKYVRLLLELQENEGLHLGTKLRKAHINFFRQKMKVRLATQLMSSSVADALIFCRDTLKLSDFKDCGPTADFIKLINDIFDILNSRSKIPPGWKKALFNENIEITRGFFLSAVHYIKNLAFTDGHLVCTSKRKTGFVGLIVCMASAINLYEDVVEKGGLHFLPLYKISQDHIELFFSSIRSRGGWNNNPTSTQFKGAYRRLLVRAQIREGGVGNCIPLEQISILNMSSRQHPLASINSTSALIDADSKSEDDVFDFNLDSLVLSEYSSHVVAYIAGFIVKQLAKKINCEQCLELMLDSNKDSALTKTKDKGGLTYASYEIINLIKRCEKILKHKGFEASYLSICSSFFDNFDFKNIFKDEDRFHESEHKILLIKTIIHKYLDIRYKHEGKNVSQSLSDRSFYTKLILFKNQ